MLSITKVISAEIDNLKRRVVKILRFGLSDVQTALEAGPFGIDSNPPKGMVAIYGPTNEKGQTVIVGYLNKNQLAEPGEHRVYSVKADGTVAIYIWMKADGTMEIGGAAKNLARFQELKSGFDELKNNFNDHVQKWNLFAAAYVPGGPSSPGTPPTASTSTASTASVDGAKIDELKTL